jgi:hypothetical protein
MTRLVAFRASGLAAFAGLIFLGIDEPAAAARGWLAALVFWSTIAIGNLVLLMVHRLTGGRWGDAAAGSMDAGAAGVPLLFVAIVPVFLATSVLYPWQDAASPPIDPAVAHIYLNLPLFAGRSVVALAGWTAIWIGLRRLRGRQGLLLAAVGLAFHAIAISLIPVDWVLSAQPRFTSSAFGATIAISQCLAGFAWIALWTSPTDERLAGDFAGLLIAGILGLVYMEFISFTVIWYGDLPNKIAWYLDRADGWAWLIVAAFLIGAVVPLALLLARRLVADARPVRAAAICVLTGLAAHDIWLVVPESGTEALAPAVLAIIALGGLWLGFSPARMRIAHA